MDHAATTPTDARVVRAMSPFFTRQFGNPLTVYSLGTEADEAVINARDQVAYLVGASPEEIYFTAGGTESDNWALKGIAWAHQAKGRHIITSRIEHHAVLEPCKFLQGQGFEVTYLPVDKYGMVDPDEVRKAIRPDTILVTIMHANNEVGTIEPVEEIGKVTREMKVLFHTDAVQTVGKIPVDVKSINCDLLSMSAHKFYGPKGMGALYVRQGVKIESLLHGGQQEKEKRAGTHNVPGIVGMGKAAEIARLEMSKHAQQLTQLTGRLWKGIEQKVSDVRFNGHPEKRIPGNVHVCVKGAEGYALPTRLELEGICAASGSACYTGSPEPSHVLLALGIPPDLAYGALRLTLGRGNTRQDVDYFLRVFQKVVKALRELSSL
jgi:cysteine desulfurase